MYDTKVARLPLTAVIPLVETDNVNLESGVGSLDNARYTDQVRRRRLAPQAAAALDAGDFYRLHRPDNYAVTVLTATACNLGCAYCFQNTAAPDPGSFAPPRIKNAALDRDLVDATVAFVRRQQNAAGLSTVSVLLFGGEPLLNIEGCVRVLEGMTGLGLADAEIVTNGVLLTLPTARALHEAGLRRVQITFDGAQQAHDQIRVTRNGRPTYATILRNVRVAAEKLPNLAWNFRVNVSHRTVGHLDRLIDDLSSIAAVARKVSFHLALIDDTGLGYENDVRHDDDLADRFIAVNRRAIAMGMRIPPSQPLSVCPYCSTVGGGRGAVINGDGGLYSCWENAGRDGWQVGDVQRGYADRASVAARWVACDFDVKSHGAPDATRRFLDRIDAAALDDQHEIGALQLSGNRKDRDRTCSPTANENAKDG
ncbi:radical SAM protein [Kribbella endophytica]